MPVAVVIELAVADRGSPHVPALLEACNRASAETSCELAPPGGEEPRGGAALAIVAWSTEHRAVRVEVALRRDERAEWFSRRLDFRPEDDEKERWRAVGLVIATVVGVASGGEAHGALLPAGERPAGVEPRGPPPAPRAPPVERERARAVEPQAAAVAIRRSPRTIDVLGLGGPALDDGTARFGFGVRASVEIRGPLFAALEARFAWRPIDPQQLAANWISFGGGLGLRVPATPWLDLEARGGLFGQVLHASVCSDLCSGSRGAAGGLVSVDLAPMPFPSIGGFVGLDLSFVPGSTAIRVAGREIGGEPVATFVVHGGLRVAF